MMPTLIHAPPGGAPYIETGTPLAVEYVTRVQGADYYVVEEDGDLRVRWLRRPHSNVVARVLGAIASVKRQRERENAVASRMGKRLAEAIREASR